MTPKLIKSTAAALLLAASLAGGAAFAPSAALADDDDLYCFEYTVNGKTELECTPIGDLKDECKLTDPETTTDVCKDVNASRIVRPQRLFGL